MLTDKEKAIALECYRDYIEEGISRVDTFDRFLSRIREEQEAIAWIDEYNWLIRKKPTSIAGVTGTVFKPLFTTPPAAPDCSELVEALKGMLAIVSDSSGVTGYHINGVVADWGEFDEVNAALQALANHAKRTKGEE